MKDIVEKLRYYRDSGRMWEDGFVMEIIADGLMTTVINEIDTLRAENARLKRAAEIDAIMAARGVSVMGDLG